MCVDIRYSERAVEKVTKGGALNLQASPLLLGRLNQERRYGLDI
jgi:hypothetical protein